MRTLTKQEIEEIKKEMVACGTPVRFMHEGQAVNVITGEKDPKGVNVMFQTVYWNFAKETAQKIAKLTGTRAVFN